LSPKPPNSIATTQSLLRSFLILKHSVWSVLVLCSMALWANYTETTFTAAFFADVEQRYGADATGRFTAWRDLINKGTTEDDWQRIHLANQFFNRQVAYQTDVEHWKKTDYWATPIESLGTGAGDCEDYAIAKYFTLRAMGVADEKLRLMYVRALSVNEPHMVLVYFESPQQYPLVLDNMDPQIKSAQDRTDLRPVYSFNASGLWLAKANGLGRRVKDSSGIRSWTEVLNKIEQGL
jgi:predicted transglutaminase-like cysteine proteinase